MRINNVSTKTSKSSLIALSMFTFVITTVLIVGYISSSNTGISPGGFFRWLVDMFQVLKESSDEPIFPLVILTSIVGIYIGFIASVISRYQAIKKFNRELNIKYINLLPGGIEFFYTQPSNNFRCAYEDIKNLYMDIHSKIVRTKHGSRIVFEQLNLTFTDLNGKKYKLSNTTPSPMKLIYKIIDYTRRVQNFEYEFSGYGEIADYKEKIDEYLHLGYKDIVGKDGEVNLKILSVLLFVFGLGWFASFADIIPSMLKHSGAMVVFLPISLFIIASFVCDIILIVDKIRDNKYRGYDGQN